MSSSVAKLSLAFSLVVGLAVTADASTDTVLYSFGSQSGDGASPYASLIYVKGKLYGTTEGLGAYQGGTVFSVTPAGKEIVLHSFGNGADGTYPYASLINVSGTLYGTTNEGGANYGFGTVFSVNPKTGAEKVVYSFCSQQNCADGGYPDAGLINVKGTLYGTTYSGGAYNDGTVYSITPAGKETVLHSFGDYPDGGAPAAGLINVKGTLYGTTEAGGSAGGGGTVFSITPAGKETVLHSFGSDDGTFPSASLANVNGTLYGTTQQGGAHDDGTVFSVTLAGKETVLHSFGNNGDGILPRANLKNVKGILYGTTEEGGGNCGSAGGCGTVFSITPAGNEAVLYSFTGANGDGWGPQAGLIDVKDMLYGTAVLGGTHNGGVVFSIAP